MIMNNTWFSLYSDTFLWLKGSRGFVYRAENNAQFVFPVSDEIKTICEQLLVLENLYTVEVTEAYTHSEAIRIWIDKLVELQAGYLTLDTVREKRPVSIQPILKVRDNVEYYNYLHQNETGGEAVQNLQELTFYFNNSRFGNNEYYRQSIFPFKNCQPLDVTKIVAFINNCKNAFLTNINLVGDLFSYPQRKEMLECMASYSYPYTLCFTIQDLVAHIDEVKSIAWPEYTSFNVLTDVIPDDAWFRVIQEIEIPVILTYFVSSEAMFDKVADMAEKQDNTRIVPIFNGTNYSFFESYVFITPQEIEETALSKKDIFMRQAVNMHDFGKLTILPDKKVYANVNFSPLGTVDDYIYPVVYKELSSGESWFRIRDQEPCRDCIYQWLCPSPSNYETVIGKANLCHINRL